MINVLHILQAIRLSYRKGFYRGIDVGVILAVVARFILDLTFGR